MPRKTSLSVKKSLMGDPGADNLAAVRQTFDNLMAYYLAYLRGDLR